MASGEGLVTSERRAPGFEVQLDGLTEAGASRFDILSLRGDSEFGTARDVPLLFLGDERAKAVGHTAMLLEVGK